MTGVQLFPGIPLTALAFVCPATAAAILLNRENGTAAVTYLLRRSFDYKRIRVKIWYAPIVLLPPSVMVVGYGLMGVMGITLPTPQFTVTVQAALVSVLVTASG